MENEKLKKYVESKLGKKFQVTSANQVHKDITDLFEVRMIVPNRFLIKKN